MYQIEVMFLIVSTAMFQKIFHPIKKQDLRKTFLELIEWWKNSVCKISGVL